MKIEFDDAKRLLTLQQRGLDFADAAEVFVGAYFEIEDGRFDYGEKRYITFGSLNGKAVVIVWTPRGNTRRIISMRHAHERELEARRRALD